MKFNAIQDKALLVAEKEIGGYSLDKAHTNLKYAVDGLTTASAVLNSDNRADLMAEFIAKIQVSLIILAHVYDVDIKHVCKIELDGLSN